MGGPSVSPRVLEVLSRHRGLDVPLAEIVKATGLEPGQIQTAINNMIRRNGLPITVVMRAQVWRYEADNAKKQAPEPQQDTYFERVGDTRSGKPIVRGDHTNTLYVLGDLDI